MILIRDEVTREPLTYFGGTELKLVRKSQCTMVDIATSTKRVEWAYPTSPNADALRFKGGCYTVEIVRHRPDGTPEPGIAIAGFSKIEDARAEAETIPLKWDRLTK